MAILSSGDNLERQKHHKGNDALDILSKYTSTTDYTSTGHSSSSEELGASTPMTPYNDQPTPLLNHPDAPSHSELVFAEWKQTLEILDGKNEVSVDGITLNISRLVAISRYGSQAYVSLEPEVTNGVHDSAKFLHQELDSGHSLYGVTTGFGGNADTRTTATKALQVGLLQMQLCGVLPVKDDQSADRATHQHLALPNGDAVTSLSMPEPWVKSAMIIRANSLLRGHSAVRLFIIENLIKLVQSNYIPLVPLRGSISASGDLSPLSYIAGLLEGNPDVSVWSGPLHSRKLISADAALSEVGLEPVTFGAKEGLGVLNGTAFSAGVASLALNEANQLVVLSQVLTAMGVEALNGEKGSFDPFIAQIRPHSGQIEVAQNISLFLKDSRLIRGEGDFEEDRDLRQDRYALRTSSQWLGPQLEDLTLAHKQLLTELNSTTDNPLFDVQNRKVHHGGNFQAATVTSSTEKTRLSLQMMGKMIFAQSCELLDLNLNNGLPPNLAIDEPSLSYTLKGVDINMAAYMSELAFLANPVSSHVQSAEMGNQSLNSLALVSARYTHMAIDILSLMCSAYLYSLCQALDLRAMNALFLRSLKPALEDITTGIFTNIISPESLQTLHRSLWSRILLTLSSTQNKDSSDRFMIVAKSAQSELLEVLEHDRSSRDPSKHHPDTLYLIQAWTKGTAKTAQEIFTRNRENYLVSPDATEFLGAASKRMYKFVRKELQIPIHRGLSDHPVPIDRISKIPKALTGSRISIIYQAIRNGRLAMPVMECLEEAIRAR